MRFIVFIVKSKLNFDFNYFFSLNQTNESLCGKFVSDSLSLSIGSILS